MRKILSCRFLAAVLVAMSCLAGSSYAAAVDYFLKIEGIEGESSDDRHKGEIEILSFSWGVTNTGSHSGGGGGGAGKASFSDISFMGSVSKASPKLMLACATGQHIPRAVLTCRKTGGDGQTFYKITLSDVMVSSYASSGGTEDPPSDALSLNFTKIEFEYITMDATGQPVSVKTGYDLALNKKI